MKSFFMGIDVSKGYADFVILDQQKQPVMENFQLDDTFQGHSQLYEILNQFLAKYQKTTLYMLLWKAPEALKTTGIRPCSIFRRPCPFKPPG